MKNVYEGALVFTLVFNIIKEELLPRILKRLCLLIRNTTFIFLTTHTLKADDTEEFLNSTDESEEEESDTFISNV